MTERRNYKRNKKMPTSLFLLALVPTYMHNFILGNSAVPEDKGVWFLL